MESWSDLKNRGKQEQCSFHFVCCERFSQKLEQIEREHFADFSGRRRAQVVNALLTVMEPYLLQQLNLKETVWELAQERGKGPICASHREKERLHMDRERWARLDLRVYRLLKKLHEAGVRAGISRGTFSMAMVLRAALILCFELLDSLGRDGLVRWVAEWMKSNKKCRAEWESLKHHMVSLIPGDAKYIAIYNVDYCQTHLYHPPPDPITT